MSNPIIWPKWADGGLRVPRNGASSTARSPAARARRTISKSGLVAAITSRLETINVGRRSRPTVVDLVPYDDCQYLVMIAVDDDLVLPIITGRSRETTSPAQVIAGLVAAHAAELCRNRQAIRRHMASLRVIAEAEVFADAGIRFTGLLLGPRQMGVKPKASRSIWIGFDMVGPKLETVHAIQDVESGRELETRLRERLRDQIRRLEQIRRLDEHGAILESDGISVRAIAGRGLDLTDLVRRTMAGEVIELLPDDAGMFFRAAAVEGFLIVEWGFVPRVYIRRGLIEVRGGLPETLLMTAAGRPIADIVDHPFLRDGPTIGNAANADPPLCSFLEVVQPALFLRRRQDGSVEAFEPTQVNTPGRPSGEKELAK